MTISIVSMCQDHYPCCPGLFFLGCKSNRQISIIWSEFKGFLPFVVICSSVTTPPVPAVAVSSGCEIHVFFYFLQSLWLKRPLLRRTAKSKPSPEERIVVFGKGLLLIEQSVPLPSQRPVRLTSSRKKCCKSEQRL